MDKIILNLLNKEGSNTLLNSSCLDRITSYFLFIYGSGNSKLLNGKGVIYSGI